jgi:hypothetical protein
MKHLPRFGLWLMLIGSPVLEATAKPGSRARPETAVRVGLADFSDSP